MRKRQMDFVNLLLSEEFPPRFHRAYQVIALRELLSRMRSPLVLIAVKLQDLEVWQRVVELELMMHDDVVVFREVVQYLECDHLLKW